MNKGLPKMLFVRAHFFFKANDVVSKRIVKTLIIKYDIYANIFAETEMWVAFYSYFLAKVSVK